MVAVEVKDLVKNYGPFEAVKGITFSVAEGEVFGLIGPNGAGKTTALRVISTLIEVTGGSVSVFDRDVVKEPNEVRKIISYLPEDAGAYKNMTGREYLSFISNFFSNSKSRDEMLRRGLDIARLEDRIDDKVETYSKGMTRRLLVARALMIEPKLAILDEPTSGLDVLNAQEIRRLIKGTVSDGGASVLLSSHNMLEVEYMCDRIALINDGKIVESGSPANLMERYGASNIEEVFVEVVK